MNGSHPFPAHAGDRTFDLRYLERPPGDHHRPYFQVVEACAHSHLTSPGASVLDVGCANGAFLDFLFRRHPSLSCTGVDVLPDLVRYAARHVPRARFHVADIGRADTLPAGTYSVVTMLTLHSHFDSLDPWLDNMVGLVRPGGRALLFGPFNPEPVDVLVRFRGAEDTTREWMPGWNIHSRASVAAHLAARGLHHHFHDYEPPPGTPDAGSDPFRTRVAVLDGRVVLTNGSGVTLPFALLEIRV